MHLMYYLDANGKRVYTLKKVAHGEVTKSAHPARFSPDDKFSRFVSASITWLWRKQHLHHIRRKQLYAE